MSEHDLIRVASSQAPAAIGPYSQAVAFGNLLFCSGQLPLDPQSAALIEGDIGQMTQRCLQNLQAVCQAAGTTLEHALKLTIYLCDLAKFKDVNEAYGSFFGDQAPARSTVGVAALPAGAEVEIDAIVAL
ncbi:MAG: Rid family detoxifying hydrolase [Solirubrobacteraceae bacterium]